MTKETINFVIACRLINERRRKMLEISIFLLKSTFIYNTKVNNKNVYVSKFNTYSTVQKIPQYNKKLI